MNSRLTVAAHILGLLAAREEMAACSVTSEQLAASVGTNAVVVRRVLGQLKAAGLVDSRRGVGGGTVLARNPREITLRMVYEAVETDDVEMLGRHASALGAGCTVAPLIAEYLDELYADAEEALRRRLELVTVAQMAQSVMERVRRQRLASDTSAPGAPRPAPLVPRRASVVS
jgi:DNA-binding IscR family transcriptional regulator